MGLVPDTAKLTRKLGLLPVPLPKAMKMSPPATGRDTKVGQTTGGPASFQHCIKVLGGGWPRHKVV
jgi:hypothetical protein